MSVLQYIRIFGSSVFRVGKGNLIIDDTGELHLREVNFICRLIESRLETGTRIVEWLR